MHALLRRQLRRHAPTRSEEVPAEWAAVFEAIGEAYEQFDGDRRLLERSLELTSHELNEKNAKIAAQKEELERSNGELEHFAYIASHDLQEPLRTVQSYVQLIQRRYADKLDADGREFMGYVVEGATRMRALIDDLLTYARVSSRARPLERTELTPLCDEVLRALAARIAEQHAVIEAAPLPEVMADRRQLGQLLQNLIANALKFHKPDAPPRVRIGAVREGAFWRVSIADDGIGIAPEYREKIFVIFQRLHSRDEYEGTGLGLAVCKKIVDRHGGKIWVESELGRGATFHFTIPVLPEGGTP